LNGSTHLLCSVRPNPLTRAVAPTNVLVVDIGGSPTGLILSETIKTHVLMQNI